MKIKTFADFLQAARAQDQPQRLLFVFTHAQLPDGASDQQRARFANGEGGALAPLMCVEKTVDEVPSFASLTAETASIPQPWTIVFAAALGRQNGAVPSSQDAMMPLQNMIDAIIAGDQRGMLPFDRDGDPVVLSA